MQTTLPDPVYHPPGWQRHLHLAFKDIRESFGVWRLWVLMATNDINQRYRRSFLGPFWLTISTGLLIASLGVVYSFLFKIPLAEYMPYLAIGQIFWVFIGSVMTEAGASFVIAEGYLKQVRVPKLALILRMTLRNLLILLHNLAIVLIVLLIFTPPVSWVTLLVIPGLLLMLLGGIACGTMLAVVCTRFRDMPQIVASLMQLVYFVTPIMWRAKQLPDEVRWMVAFNPFAAYIELVRDPLLGIAPPPESWYLAGGVTLVTMLIAFIFFARFRSRITYWL